MNRDTWNLRVRVYFILSDRVPKAYCLLILKIVEQDFQKMSVFTKLDKLGRNRMKKLWRPQLPQNILTLNYFAQLRLNYLIVSSNRGTVVRLIRKVELRKKTICCYGANWFVVSVFQCNLPFSGWIFQSYNKSFFFGMDGCLLYSGTTTWETKQITRINIIKWGDFLIFYWSQWFDYPSKWTFKIVVCSHWSIGVFRRG